MKLNVLSVCTQTTVDELLSKSPCAKAQSDFLNLQWLQDSLPLTLDAFLDELQRSVNENSMTVVLDGSDGFYTKAMIAEGLDLPLEENSSARAAVEAYAKDRGFSMGGRLAEGARLPLGSSPLCSKSCVDQGFILVRGGRCIVVFPVAAEVFDSMFRQGLYPFLLRNGAETAVVQTIAIRSNKVADVQEYLRLFRHGKGILAFVYEEDGQNYLSVTAIRGNESDSRQACESLLENIEAEMGAFILTEAVAKKEARTLKTQNRKGSGRALQAAQELYEEENKDNKKKKKAKKSGFGFVRKLLLFICICTFLGSSGYLGLRFYRSKANIQDYNSLREVYENGGFPAMGYPLNYDNSFSGLYQLNEDVAGWLSIEGTSLDYPVVQTTDNTYYHRLSFEGDYSLYGVPFVDCNVDLKEPSTNTIIYGHNIKNDDQMFNSLLHYWDPAYFVENPIIDFHTVYGKRQYKIFGAFVANVNPDHGEVFQYHTFIDGDSAADVQEFIYNVKVRSILNTGVDVQPSDELLTLSTCTYEFDNARFVIVARRLRDGESPEVDASQVSKASAPLMPDIWYQLYGGSKPVLEVPTFVDTIVLETNDVSPLDEVKEEVKEELPEPVEETPAEETVEAAAPVIPPAAETAPPPVASPPTETPPAVQSPAPTPETPPQEEVKPETEENTPPAAEEAPKEEAKEEPKEETPAAPEKEEAPAKSEEKPKEETPAPVDEEEEQEEEPEEEDEEIVSDYDPDEKISVKINGSKVKKSAYDVVCMMVQAEMGTTFHQEALKAQAVAAYTYVKYNNSQGISPSVAGKTSISSNVAKAVESVIGQAVYYKGNYANTTYCAANAGVSNNCVDVWGGNLPYLVSVDSEGDEETNHYGYQTKLKLSYVADRIEDYHNVDPYDYSDDPDDWFGDYSNGAGLYVSQIKVCGRKLTGRKVREGLLESKIRSAAFEVEYDDSEEVFIFTTYGYGHGVGMSQLGANYYAKEGWSYDEILEHYYSGTKVG